MRIVAYLYIDPLLESQPSPDIWGWEVDRVYQDLAIRHSPTQTNADPTSPANDRDEWQQLLQDCQAFPVDYLLIRRLEELGGSVQEVSDRLGELESLGVSLIAIEQLSSMALLGSGPHPTILPATDFRANLLKLLQQMQQQQRGQKIRQSHARNRVQALPPPGRAPYGYRRGKNRYALDRATAPVVKEFFEEFLLYGSVRGAVRHLAKKYGKKISASTGHRWLTNPVYRGDLEYQTGEIIPDTHVPIISRDEAAQVDRLLRRNRRLPPRTASAPRSLSGLVVCAGCQSPMTITRVTTPHRPQEYLYIRPTRCPQKPKCKAIAYDQVLQQTIERICTELPQAVAGMSAPDMDQIKQGIGATIAARQAILSQISPLVEQGILDQETADLRMYKLRAEIAALQAKLAQLPPVNLRAIAQTVSIPQFWLDLSETERRFYFREFIRQIDLIRQDQEWQLKLVFIF